MTGYDEMNDPEIPKVFKMKIKGRRCDTQDQFLVSSVFRLPTALLDENQNMLAVARLVAFDFKNEKFIVQSTFNGNKKEIKGIQFGSLKVTKDGSEAGFIEPGSF